jgi:hypothetical protein
MHQSAFPVSEATPVIAGGKQTGHNRTTGQMKEMTPVHSGTQ